MSSAPTATGWRRWSAITRRGTPSAPSAASYSNRTQLMKPPSGGLSPTRPPTTTRFGSEDPRTRFWLTVVSLLLSPCPTVPPAISLRRRLDVGRTAVPTLIDPAFWLSRVFLLCRIGKEFIYVSEFFMLVWFIMYCYVFPSHTKKKMRFREGD